MTKTLFFISRKNVIHTHAKNDTHIHTHIHTHAKNDVFYIMIKLYFLHYNENCIFYTMKNNDFFYIMRKKTIVLISCCFLHPAEWTFHKLDKKKTIKKQQKEGERKKDKTMDFRQQNIRRRGRSVAFFWYSVYVSLSQKPSETPNCSQKMQTHVGHHLQCSAVAVAAAFSASVSLLTAWLLHCQLFDSES